MISPQLNVLCALVDSASRLERHALVLEIERASQADPRPWIAAVRQLREARTLDTAVDHYLLHLITSHYILELATADVELQRRCAEVRRLCNYEGTDHASPDSEEFDLAAHDAAVLDARERVSARYHEVEQEFLQVSGEDAYAFALRELDAVLEQCRDARDHLLGASWPLGFEDALRLTGDLAPPRAMPDPRELGSDIAERSPREGLLRILDIRAPADDRRWLVHDLERLAELDPRPWIAALRELRAEGLVHGDMDYFLIDNLVLSWMFTLDEEDHEDVRIRQLMEGLVPLYRADPDAPSCDDEEIGDPLPADMTILRDHRRARESRFIQAVLQELGERDVAADLAGWRGDAHMDRYWRGEAQLGLR